MRSGYLSVAVSVLVLASISFGFAPTDADPSVDKTFYCYSDELAFGYGGSIEGGVTVEWSAYGYDEEGNRIEVGMIEPLPSKDNHWSVKFDPADVSRCSYVYVTQAVTDGVVKDVMTYKVIILPMDESGQYQVTFYDGYTGEALSVTIIDATGYVEEGGNHVVPPEPPVREGYSFLGWYIGPDMTERFDPTKPVTSDMDIYAKWAVDAPDPSPAPGPGPAPGATLVSIMVAGDYITEYGVGDNLNTTGLTVIAKYSEGTMIEVTSSCVFSPTHFDEAGEVTVKVTFQDKETSFKVTVSEEQPVPPVPDEPSEDNGGGMTAIIVIVVAVLIVALAAAFVLKRHRN